MDSVEGKRRGRLTIPYVSGRAVGSGTEELRAAFRTTSNVRQICELARHAYLRASDAENAGAYSPPTGTSQYCQDSQSSTRPAEPIDPRLQEIKSGELRQRHRRTGLLSGGQFSVVA